jgi:hypothetical protein
MILPSQWLSPTAQRVQDLLIQMQDLVKDESSGKAWDLSVDILTQVMVASPPDIPQLVRRHG